MAKNRIKLLEYITEEGKNHFGEWIRELKDSSARAHIRVRLNRIRLGNFGDCKSVGKGVSELRVPYGPGYRVYFAKSGNTNVLLLLGGDKGSQTKDIKLAQRYWAEYKRRST